MGRRPSTKKLRLAAAMGLTACAVSCVVVAAAFLGALAWLAITLVFVALLCVGGASALFVVIWRQYKLTRLRELRGKLPTCPECGAYLPRKGIRGWADKLVISNLKVKCAKCGRLGCQQCCVAGKPSEFPMPPVGGPVVAIPSWIHKRCQQQ